MHVASSQCSDFNFVAQLYGTCVEVITKSLLSRSSKIEISKHRWKSEKQQNAVPKSWTPIIHSKQFEFKFEARFRVRIRAHKPDPSLSINLIISLFQNCFKSTSVMNGVQLSGAEDTNTLSGMIKERPSILKWQFYISIRVQWGQTMLIIKNESSGSSSHFHSRIETIRAKTMNSC